MVSKICKKCDKEKNIDEFYKHQQMGDGYLSFCKECVRKRVRGQSRSEAGRRYDHKRNQTPKRKAWLRQYLAKRRSANPERTRAVQLANNAVRDGKLVKKPCEVCGTTENIQKHHDDYSKPLDIRWLCGKHHRELHKQFQRID